MNGAIEYTKELTRFLHDLSFRDLSSATVTKAKELTLDYLGYASRSVNEAPARILHNLTAKMGGAGCATIIGTGRKASPMWAALVNGAMGHMTELDDTHHGSQSHMGEAVIPAALAAAEDCQADGEAVLTAIVAGYECGIRAGLCVMPSHYVKGWHPSGTMTTFGAAMAAGKTLGLSYDQMLHALGIAGTQAAGSFVHLAVRGMTKDLNPGKAAANGVLAAYLARDGFTSSHDVFENPKGWMALYSDSPNPETLIEKLGEPFYVHEVVHKLYPGCYHMHTAREAARRVAEEHAIRAERIDEVVARLYAIGAYYTDDPEPWADGKGLQGPRFSAQFQIALALCEGLDGLWASYDEEYVRRKMEDSRIRDMMGRIRIIHDEEMQKAWPHALESSVTIRLDDGTEHYKMLQLPRDEKDPNIQDDIEKKFSVVGAHLFTPERVSSIRAKVAMLEAEKNLDALCALLHRDK